MHHDFDLFLLCSALYFSSAEDLPTDAPREAQRRGESARKVTAAASVLIPPVLDLGRIIGVRGTGGIGKIGIVRRAGIGR